MKPKYLLLTLLALFGSGCDKLCDTTVKEFTTINNNSERELEIEICKGTFEGKQTIKISADQLGTMALGSSKGQEVVGGPTSCDKNKIETSHLPIALTSESFGEVKFCYPNEDRLQVDIFEAHQSCPAGYLEQVEAVDDCEG